MNQKLKITNQERGFTIIEALVTMLVVAIGLIPGLYAASLAKGLSESIENTLVASYLAQEGLEVIRYLRDKNSIDCGDFSTGLVGSWRIESSPGAWNCASRSLTPVGTNPPLLIDSSGRYNYTTGTPTKFRRRVTVTQVVANVEMRVIVEVSWLSRNRTTEPGCTAGYQCVIAESHLYNWLR